MIILHPAQQEKEETHSRLHPTRSKSIVLELQRSPLRLTFRRSISQQHLPTTATHTQFVLNNALTATQLCNAAVDINTQQCNTQHTVTQVPPHAHYVVCIN